MGEGSFTGAWVTSERLCHGKAPLQPPENFIESLLLLTFHLVYIICSAAAELQVAGRGAEAEAERGSDGPP